MKNLTVLLMYLTLIITWIMGSVIAFHNSFWCGFWSVVTGPFYSWYLLVEHTMAVTGFYPR